MGELDQFAKASPKWLNSACETVIGVDIYGSRKVTLKDSSGNELMTAANPINTHMVDTAGNTLGIEANPVITALADEYGWKVENTPMDELRVVSPYRLVGSIFSNSSLDTNFWTATLATGAAATVGNSQCILSTGGTPNATATLQSVRMARYIGGASNRFRAVLTLPDSGTSNNIRRWGAFDANNGAFFELNASTFSVVTRKGGIDTPIANGSFNGIYATITANLTSVFTAEIYWTNSKVYFTHRGHLVHTVNAETTTWSDALTLPVRFDNLNTANSTANVAMNIRTGTIFRLGHYESQPISYFAKSAGVTVLKHGAGNLHGMTVADVLNGSIITLIDEVTSAGRTIFSTGPMNATTQPFSLDFHNVPFYSGLTLVVSAAISYSITAYE